MPSNNLFSLALLGGWVLSLFVSFYTVAATKTDFIVEKVVFISQQTTLAGSVVFPAHQSVNAAVVFVHGSGKQTRSLHWAKQFAKYGIATLVYDKRGVGESGGEYESKQSVSGMNIKLLANDAAAALLKLSQHPKIDGVPLGLTGISQAGWIVPIAAQGNQLVDFTVIWSGPVCKVSEEDIYSRYTRDSDVQSVPSYAQALEARKSPYSWPAFLGEDSDPSTNLHKQSVPGLWIFGENDGSVPVDLSIERLRELNIPHLEYVLFSKAGHNNMPESFATAIDWIKRLPK